MPEGSLLANTRRGFLFWCECLERFMHAYIFCISGLCGTSRKKELCPFGPSAVGGGPEVVPLGQVSQNKIALSLNAKGSLSQYRSYEQKRSKIHR